MGQTKKIVVASLMALLTAVGGMAGYSLAAPAPLNMVPMGSAQGPFRDSGILKLLDPAENVVCYVLAPERVSHKLNSSGQALYEGNNIGSISCVKRDGAAPAGAPPQPGGIRRP
jgi:hypothetical protein